jgi:hypothetical protein
MHYDTPEEILARDYSTRFDEIRKNMMVVSHYKYGWLSECYSEYKCMDAVKNMELRIAKYKETGNTEFLADVANFAMIEFMYPQHPNAHYKPTDTGACEVAGFGVNEIKNWEG